jgi:hypothetical protein
MDNGVPVRDRFDDGDMFKIKTLWYHNLNRGLHMMTKTKTNNEKFMYYSTLPPISFHTHTQSSLSLSLNINSDVDAHQVAYYSGP